MSRIAHSVYFLGDDECKYLLGIIRRVAEFSGVKLLGWCIMNNHFHLLVYLPEPVELSDEQVLARYKAIRGEKGVSAILDQFEKWSELGDKGEKFREEWFRRTKRRMYNIGEFVKIIKQWFTEDYNRSHTHNGTLWQSVYVDRLVKNSIKDLSERLGYIHLNPIRAAICTGYTEYPWSSFNALANGDETALDGIRHVYDNSKASKDGLIASHSQLLDTLLEGVKRQRALEIARIREKGKERPTDPLTEEALIAQESVHLAKLQNLMMREDDIVHAKKNRSQAKAAAERAIVVAITRDPTISTSAICEMLNLPERTVFRYLRNLQKQGVLAKLSRVSPWIVIPTGS